MTAERIRNYIEERDKMLLKCSVDELRKFVKKYDEFYSAEMHYIFMTASDEVLEITLHKMIVHASNIPAPRREKSREWLLRHGYDLSIV